MWSACNYWGETVCRCLLIASVSAAALFLLAWLILTLGRVRAAVHRHAVWLCCLIGILIVPALWLYAPKLKLPVLPSPPVVTAPLQELISPEPSRPPVALGNVPAVAASTASPAPALSVVPSPVRPATVRPFPFKALLAGLWVAGVMVMLIRLAFGWRRIRRISRTARSLDESEARTSVHLPGVRLLVSTEVPGPVCFGIVSPTILLPAGLLERSMPAQVRMILNHELAHIQRRDGLVNVVQRLVEAALFFHPFVWWASRLLTQERERICDNWVIAQGGDADRYAALLSQLAEEAVESVRLQGVALHEGGLLSRIRDLLNPSHARLTRLSRLTALTCALVAILAFGVFGIVRLSHAQEKAAGGDEANPRVIPAQAQPHGVPTITGWVSSEDGKPVEGAIVYLGNTGILAAAGRQQGDGEKDITWTGGYGHPACVRSDAKGRFTFNMLRWGETDVWAEHPSAGWACQLNVRTDATDIQLFLTPRSKEVSYSGTFLDANGKPAAGGIARLYSEDNAETTCVAESAIGDDGWFFFDIVPVWTYSHYLTLVGVPKTGAMVWRCLPICSVANIELRSRPEARITGRVIDMRDNAVTGATVYAYAQNDPEYGALLREAGVPTTTTDKTGEFTLGGLPRECHAVVQVQDPDYMTGYCWEIPLSEAEVRIKDIRLPDGITIEGTVRYADANAPAPGVRVAPIYGREGPKVITDGAGAYRLKGYPLWEDDAARESHTLQAQSLEAIPVWSGETTIKPPLKPGDHVTGVNILLHKTPEARMEEWKKTPGKPQASAFSVALLDDADPAFNGKDKYADTLSVYDAQGRLTWQYVGLNTCQTVGGNHEVAWNPVDGSLWTLELVGNRLMKFSKEGKLLLQKADFSAQALAVDPKTGLVWIATSSDTIYGSSLLTLDPRDGKIVANWEIAAFDIAYSRHDDCFWLAGKKVLKVSRTGKILFQSQNDFAWLAVSIGVNDQDGSVYVVERGHSDVADSRDRILILDADGKERKAVDLEVGWAACVAVDSQHNCAWVATSNGVLKVSSDGKLLLNAPIRSFSVCVEPDTGYVWVAGRKGLYRLDQDGRAAFARALPRDSQKWLCAMDAREGAPGGGPRETAPKEKPTADSDKGRMKEAVVSPDAKAIGPTVEEGVAFRIWSDKVIWDAGVAPVLGADLSHRGKRELLRLGAYEMDFDGAVYVEHVEGNNNRRDFDPDVFRPQTDARGIGFVLDDNWRSGQTGNPLQLTAGRHTIRLAFNAQAGDDRVRILSNVVEFRVLAPGEKATEDEWFELAVGWRPGSRYSAKQVAEMHREKYGETLAPADLAKFYAKQASELSQRGPDPVVLADIAERALAFEQDDLTRLRLYTILGEGYAGYNRKFPP